MLDKFEKEKTTYSQYLINFAFEVSKKINFTHQKKTQTKIIQCNRSRENCK